MYKVTGTAGRSICALTALTVALLVPGGSPATAAGPRFAPLPDVTAGAVDVVPSLTSNLAIPIQISLSTPTSEPVVVVWRVHALSANLVRDFRVSVGTLTIAPGSLDGSAIVTVAPLAVAVGTTCFFQSGDTCRTFSLTLSVPDGHATVAATSTTDALLVPDQRSTAAVLTAGDAYVVAPPQGHHVTIDVPVTMSEARSTPTHVSVFYEKVTALSPRDYRTTETRFDIAAGQLSAEIPIVINAAGLNRSPYVFDVKIISTNDTVRRSEGTVVIETPSTSVIHDATGDFDSATLTQDVWRSNDLGDSYELNGTSSDVTVSAPSTNRGSNSRAVFWPASEVSGTDSVACATWAAQSPAQSDFVVIQQGFVIDAVTQDGITRALTVTKDIFPYLNDIINVHEWDTSLATPFTLLHQFTMSDLGLTLPWDLCARVTGDDLQFIVWTEGSTPPAWGSATRGGDVTLPSAFDVAGEDGWYIGHLKATNTATFDNLTVGGPGLRFDGYTM
jgi:hypothetical protein